MFVNTKLVQQDYIKISNHSNWYQSVKVEYRLFANILKKRQCEETNRYATTSSFGNSQNDIDYLKKRKYSKMSRRKRGVMENIVSAYSDIFSKG